MCSWRAGCGGSRTSGSEGGGEETTGRKADTGASPPTLRVIVEGGNARLPTEAAAAGLFSSRPLRRSSCSGFPRRACAAAVVVARMPETSQRRPGRFGVARSLRGWASGLVFAPTCLRSRRIGGQVGARRSLPRRGLDLVIVNVASTGDSVLLGVRRRLTRRRRFTTLGFALVIDQPLSKGASHEQDRDDERGNAGRECHGRRE
jgi:hypothetical protein